MGESFLFWLLFAIFGVPAILVGLIIVSSRNSGGQRVSHTSVPASGAVMPRPVSLFWSQIWQAVRFGVFVQAAYGFMYYFRTFFQAAEVTPIYYALGYLVAGTAGYMLFRGRVTYPRKVIPLSLVLLGIMLWAGSEFVNDLPPRALFEEPHRLEVAYGFLQLFGTVFTAPMAAAMMYAIREHR